MINSVLCCMLGGMEQQRRRKDWRETESLEDAARRLIGVMDERANAKKTLAGGVLGPAEIRDPAPTVLEKVADSENDWGLSSFDRCPPVAAAGEDGSGLGAGGVGCAGPVEPDDVTMRPPATSADSNRYDFTTGPEGQSRAVRWGKK
ncbi:hypothetical protein [Mesorhizobium sp.]|uniref:hypothetical protein n=1 Tax=Mesorhizobium sp. TaxID=1871066 RepID=UPI000FE95B5B|nr:hypothetical protein [Mesorhizobium sp.]RWO22841.1 MAG: hypothetical protein EOS09_19430 [Mesorhizobium sp.]